MCIFFLYATAFDEFQKAIKAKGSPSHLFVQRDHSLVITGGGGSFPSPDRRIIWRRLPKVQRRHLHLRTLCVQQADRSALRFRALPMGMTVEGVAGAPEPAAGALCGRKRPSCRESWRVAPSGRLYGKTKELPKHIRNKTRGRPLTGRINLLRHYFRGKQALCFLLLCRGLSSWTVFWLFLLSYLLTTNSGASYLRLLRIRSLGDPFFLRRCYSDGDTLFRWIRLLFQC